MQQGVLLRRTKGSKIDGKPIVDLPPREVAHARLDFPPAERANYDRLQAQSAAELKVPFPVAPPCCLCADGLLPVGALMPTLPAAASHACISYIKSGGASKK